METGEDATIGAHTGNTPRQAPKLPTANAKAALKRLTDELVGDIQKLATIYAKNDGTRDFIDTKHITLAHNHLTDKYVDEEQKAKDEKKKDQAKIIAWFTTLFAGALAGWVIPIIVEGVRPGYTLQGIERV